MTEGPDREFLGRLLTGWHEQFGDAALVVCEVLARTTSARVELGRGVVGPLIKYVNVMHEQSVLSPFAKLAVAGMMPDRAQPRARVLQEVNLPTCLAGSGGPVG